MHFLLRLPNIQDTFFNLFDFTYKLNSFPLSACLRALLVCNILYLDDTFKDNGIKQNKAVYVLH